MAGWVRGQRDRNLMSSDTSKSYLITIAPVNPIFSSVWQQRQFGTVNQVSKQPLLAVMLHSFIWSSTAGAVHAVLRNFTVAALQRGARSGGNHPRQPQPGRLHVAPGSPSAPLANISMCSSTTRPLKTYALERGEPALRRLSFKLHANGH